jgi:hypothetical protein
MAFVEDDPTRLLDPLVEPGAPEDEAADPGQALVEGPEKSSQWLPT